MVHMVLTFKADTYIYIISCFASMFGHGLNRRGALNCKQEPLWLQPKWSGSPTTRPEAYRYALSILHLTILFSN